jgi:hypothetical protein
MCGSPDIGDQIWDLTALQNALPANTLPANTLPANTLPANTLPSAKPRSSGTTTVN